MKPKKLPIFKEVHSCIRVVLTARSTSFQMAASPSGTGRGAFLGAGAAGAAVFPAAGRGDGAFAVNAPLSSLRSSASMRSVSACTLWSKEGRQARMAAISSCIRGWLAQRISGSAWAKRSIARSARSEPKASACWR